MTEEETKLNCDLFLWLQKHADDYDMKMRACLVTCILLLHFHDEPENIKDVASEVINRYLTKLISEIGIDKCVI